MTADEWIGLLLDAGYDPKPHGYGVRQFVAVSVEPKQLLTIGSDVAAQTVSALINDGEDESELVMQRVADVAETMRRVRQGVDINGDDLVYWPGLPWPREVSVS